MANKIEIQLNKLNAENYLLKNQIDILKNKIYQIFIFGFILFLISFFLILFDIQENNISTQEISKIKSKIMVLETNIETKRIE